MTDERPPVFLVVFAAACVIVGAVNLVLSYDSAKAGHVGLVAVGVAGAALSASVVAALVWERHHPEED